MRRGGLRSATSSPSPGGVTSPPFSPSGASVSGAPAGASAAANDPGKQFPLFKLVRVLGVAVAAPVTAGPAPDDWVAVRAPSAPSTQAPALPGSASSGGASGGASAGANGRGAADLQHAAVGGCVGHAFLAVSAANEHVLVRYMGESGFPLVRAIPWYRDPARRVVALAFNPSAEWLLLASADGALHLLPLFALVVQQEQQAAATALQGLAAEGADAGAHLAAAALPVIGGPRSGPSGLASARAGAGSGPAAPLLSAPNGAPERVSQASSGSYDWLGRLPSLMTYALDPAAATAAAAAAPAGVDADGELGSLEDLTPLWPPARLAVRHPTTGAAGVALAWWRTWAGVDCAIVGTAAGVLSVIELRHRVEVYTARLKHAITRVDIVDDMVQSFRYLLVHTDGGGYHKLVLEQQTDDYHLPDTLLAAPGRPPFAVVPVQRFQRDRIVTLQRAKQGAVLGVYHPPTLKFEIYSPEMNKYALFIYQLFGAADHLLLTDKFIFAVDQDQRGIARLSVVSNLVAGTSATPLLFVKQRRDSIMQEFRLPPGETVVSLQRAYAVSRMAQEKYRADPSIEAPLEGCLLITNRAVYELRPNVAAETVFFSLLTQSKDKTAAETLGKTVGLDLYQLYEAAADQLFHDGHLDRALELYQLSNVRTSKLIDLFLQINKPAVVLSHLQGILSQPDAVAANDRRRYADVVFRIYLQKLLALAPPRTLGARPTPTTPASGPPLDPIVGSTPIPKGFGGIIGPLSPAASSEASLMATPPVPRAAASAATPPNAAAADPATATAATASSTPRSTDPSDAATGRYALLESHFRAFLLRNADYDFGVALFELLKHGWTELFFEVAHARNVMAVALNVLVNRGALQISKPHLRFLIKHGYADQLAQAGDGVLLRGLDAEDQADVLLASQHPSATGVPLLMHALPHLDDRRLRRISQYVEPSAHGRLLRASAAAPAAAIAGANERTAARRTSAAVPAAVQPEDVMHLYLATLVHLSLPDRRARRPRGSAESDEPAAPAAPETDVPPAARSRRALTFQDALAAPAATADGASRPSPLPGRRPSISGSSSKLDDGPADEPAAVLQTLRTQLRERAGAYSPTVLLRLCYELQHWDAMAEVYDLLHDWPQAMACRLQALRAGATPASAGSPGQDGVAAELAAAVAVLQSYEDRVRPPLSPLQGLLAATSILHHWHVRQLALEPLEVFVQGRLDVLAEPIGALMAIAGAETDATTASAADDALRHASALVQRFAPSLFLAITERRLQLLAALDAKDKESRIPQARLWSEIKVNLDKDLLVRLNLSLPTTSLQGRKDAITGGLSDPNDRDVVAFTCAHTYTRREYYEQMLPELRRRLDALPTPMPLTGSLWLADYYLPRMHMACPVCTFNGVRQDLLKAQPDLTERIRVWAT